MNPVNKESSERTQKGRKTSGKISNLSNHVICICNSMDGFTKDLKERRNIKNNIFTNSSDLSLDI
jgi:hypothetical protein